MSASNDNDQMAHLVDLDDTTNLLGPILTSSHAAKKTCCSSSSANDAGATQGKPLSVKIPSGDSKKREESPMDLIASGESCCKSDSCQCKTLLSNLATHERNKSQCSHCQSTNKFLDSIQNTKMFGIVMKILAPTTAAEKSPLLSTPTSASSFNQADSFHKLVDHHQENDSPHTLLKNQIYQLAEHLSQKDSFHVMKLSEKNDRYVGFIMNVHQSLAHVLEKFRHQFADKIAFVRALKVEKLVLRVNSIKCGNCVKSIQRSLEPLPDVLGVGADVSQKLLHVYVSKKSSSVRVLHQLMSIGRDFELISPANTFARYFMEPSSMRCGGCASKIRSTLEEKLGDSLFHVSTDVATKEVMVLAHLDPDTDNGDGKSLDSADITQKDGKIEAILRDDMKKEFHKVQPDTKRHTLLIEGMKCGNCVNKVKAALEEYCPGFVAAKIELKEESTILASADRTEIVRIIKDLGFTVHGEDAELEDNLAVASKEDAELHSSSAQKSSSSPLLQKDIEIEMPADNDITATTKFVFSVTGMSCASCVSKIEKKVQNMTGVLQCSVSLLSQRATVQLDEGLTDPSEVEDAIQGLGFGAEKIEQLNDDQVMLSVPQLNSSIMTTIVSSLDQEKVKLIDSNFKKRTIKLEYQPKSIKVREILNLLSEKGVVCELMKDDAASREHLLRTREIRLYRNLFVFSLGFTVLAMIFGMILGHIPPLKPILGYNIWRGLTPHFLIIFLLVTPVQFVGGFQFYKLSFKAIRALSPDMNTLISVGAWVSYLLSLFNMIYSMIVWDPSIDFKPSNYMETSAALITFLLLGRVIENFAKSKTSSALVALLDLSPKRAMLVEKKNPEQNLFDAEVEEIDAQLLAVGDIFKVAPGEKIAADGLVVRGESSCDEAMITGESVPVPKTVDNEVIGGTVNVDGVLFVEVLRMGNNSTLSKIARLVEEAQTEKPQLQAVVDRISSVFVPAVLIVSCLVFVLWLVLGFVVIPSDWIPAGLNPVTLALIFGASVTVVACPCALGLATPLAIMVGTGIGAKHGVLIKGGAALEQAKRTTAICFDKTGTLTEGKLSVDAHVLIEENGQEIMDSEFVFKALGAAESSSEHPIARALVRFAKYKIYSATHESNASDLLTPVDDEELKQVSLPEVESFKNIPGRGLTCVIDGRKIALGNQRHMEEQDVSGMDSQQLNSIYEKRRTLVFLSIDGRLAAAFGLSDEIREQAKRLVARLQSMKIDVFMVTGDNQDVAVSVGEQVGIPETHIHANTTPEGKKQVIEKLQQSDKKHSVMHIGDGINDSPALAQADVGLAVGEGTDIAMECADIVLVKNNLAGVVTAIHLSRATYRRILVNLCFAFGYNLIAVPLAAGILFPIPGLHWIIPPWVAGVAMGLSSISVTASSLLLGVTYRKPKL